MGEAAEERMRGIQEGDILTIEHRNGEIVECEVLGAETISYVPASQGACRLATEMTLSIRKYTTEDGETVWF
jgi:hypothetical protein